MAILEQDEEPEPGSCSSFGAPSCPASPSSTPLHLPKGARQILQCLAAEQILALTVTEYDGLYGPDEGGNQQRIIPVEPLTTIATRFPHLIRQWRKEEDCNSQHNRGPRCCLLTWCLQLEATPPLPLIQALVEASSCCGSSIQEDNPGLRKQGEQQEEYSQQQRHLDQALQTALANPWVPTSIVAFLYHCQEQQKQCQQHCTRFLFDLCNRPCPAFLLLPLENDDEAPNTDAEDNSNTSGHYYYLQQEQEALLDLLQTLFQQQQQQQQQLTCSDNDSNKKNRHDSMSRRDHIAARMRMIQQSAVLVDPHKSTMGQDPHAGWTLFHALAHQGGWCGVSVFEFLLEPAKREEQHCDVHNNHPFLAQTWRHQWTPLHLFCQSNNNNQEQSILQRNKAGVAAFLCRHTPEVVHHFPPPLGKRTSMGTTTTTTTPLELAVQQQQPLVVIQAMMAALSLSSSSSEDATICKADGDISTMARCDDKEVLRLPPQIRTTRLLHYALERKQPHVVQYLCQMFPQSLSASPKQLEQQYYTTTMRTLTLSNNDVDHHYYKPPIITIGPRHQLLLLIRMATWPLHWACYKGAPLANLAAVVDAHPAALWSPAGDMALPSSSRRRKPSKTPLAICQCSHGTTELRTYLTKAMKEYALLANEEEPVIEKC